MSVRDLSGVDIEQLVSCLTVCFEDYYVPFPPADVDYWKHRFRASGVDYTLSFGLFDDRNELVAFVIHAARECGGSMLAHNAGTGVLPAHRGKHVVDFIYAFATPVMKSRGISACTLEVIQINAPALKTYTRIGFHITKRYACFKGSLPPSNFKALVTEASAPDERVLNPNHHYYSWDNVDLAVSRCSDYVRYEVSNAVQARVGFFVVNPMSGYIPQFEIYEGDEVACGEISPSDADSCARDLWTLLFDGISQITQTVTVNNVDERRHLLIEKLTSLGLENFINQYEMELKLQ